MFKVLYEDDSFIAVEKEQGFVCVPDPGDADSLLEAVKREVSPSAELCHRLDRNTGGIVLFAKNPQALADAEQAMKDGEISKTYTAVLAGRPAGLFGDGKTFKTLKAFHFKDAKKGTVYIYDTPRKLAREIITKVKPLSYDPVSDTTLCDIMLVMIAIITLCAIHTVCAIFTICTVHTTCAVFTVIAMLSCDAVLVIIRSVCTRFRDQR